jgi:hypothetical protein
MKSMPHKCHCLGKFGWAMCILRQAQDEGVFFVPQRFLPQPELVEGCRLPVQRRDVADADIAVKEIRRDRRIG